MTNEQQQAVAELRNLVASAADGQPGTNLARAFSKIEVMIDQTQSALEATQRERDEALNEIDYLAGLAGHSPIMSCPPGTTIAERLKERDELQAKLALESRNREVFEKENVKLREDYIKTAATLAQSEAAGAEMREALEGCNEMFDTYGHTSESPCQRDKEIVVNMLKALSSTCGTAFLAERERHVKALEAAEERLTELLQVHEFIDNEDDHQSKATIPVLLLVREALKDTP